MKKILLVFTMLTVIKASAQLNEFPGYAPIEKYDITFATLERGGYLKDLSNLNGSLASNISYIARSLTIAYNATTDDFFLNRLSLMINDILNTRDDKSGVKSSRGTVAGWSCNAFTNGENHVWMIHSGLILEPILDYLIILKRHRYLFEQNKERYENILAEAEKSAAVFESEYVKNDTRKEGYFTDVFLKNNYGDTGNLPFNHQNIMGIIYLKLYYLTENDKYRQRAIELSNFFKRHLVIAKNNSYVWEYRVPISRSLNEYPDSEKIPKDFNHIGANISVAAIDVRFAVLCNKTGIAFDLTDINRFLGTFGNFYRGYGHAASNIDGSGDIHNPANFIQLGRWMDLAEFDYKVWESIENEYNAYIVEPVFSGPVLLSLANLALFEKPNRNLTSGLLWTLNKFSYQYNKVLEDIGKENKFNAYEFNVTRNILNYILNLSSVFIIKNRTEYRLLKDWYVNIVTELQGGNNVFEGSFTEPGKYTNHHTIFKKDGDYYLYYTHGDQTPDLADLYYFGFRKPGNEKSINLAVSKDLKNWDFKGEMWKVSDNSWDSRVIWSPGILEDAGRYYMFYTGCSRQITQRIGLAVSEDLINWQKRDKAVFSPDTSWAYWREGAWADCRDPFVIKDGNKYVMYYSSRSKNLNYVIAAATSTDLINWTDRGPILEGARIPMESPCVVKKDGRYHLFYVVSSKNLYHALSADPLTGWQNASGAAFQVDGFDGSNVELVKENDGFLLSYNKVYPHLIALVQFGTLKEVGNNVFKFSIKE